MQYKYIKSDPNKRRTITMRIIFATFLIGSGALLIVWVAWPIISFSFQYRHLYDKAGGVVSPLAKNISIRNVDKQKNSVSGISSIDYTKASNWFPSVSQKENTTGVDSYRISIPKLGIIDAYIIIGSNDLDKSLIHYGGTGVPGEYGNAVVFGHSVLPQFYDPTNYKSIFSTLPKLKEGDEVNVEYDGVFYTYEVVNMRVTSPEDVSGLEQRYDDSYLKLVTCVPPGTYNSRLWVTTKLKKNA